MKRAIYPGTFDPPTLGHLTIIQRASSLFDQLYVAIGQNGKKNSFFSIEERKTFLKMITQELHNVEVVSFEGLLVDYAKKMQIPVVLRSIRNGTDFDEETLLASMNAKMGLLETLYLVPDDAFRHISSSLVREVGRAGGPLHFFVPKAILEPVSVGLCVS